VNRMRFGIFMAPFHLPNTRSVNIALHRDVQLVQLCDELGFDEAWFGEHHSCGCELIGDPMTMIAYTAPITDRIKLGTGVVSLPYHNPFWMAERAIQLDHLTRGRAMLGLGPGALAKDAAMIGMDPVEQRDAFEEDVDVLMHLIRSPEPLSIKTSRYELREALVQIPPYTDFEVLIAAVVSPSGPRIAGKHGLSLLSLAATSQAEVLSKHRAILEDRAVEFAVPAAPREAWRLVAPMHIAETRKAAYEEVRYGIDVWFDYRQHVTPSPQFAGIGDTTEERIRWVVESGLGVIGTPEDAIEQIRQMQRMSSPTGGEEDGFGTLLISEYEWARTDAVERSHRLFADEVMPAFQFAALDRRRITEASARETAESLNAKMVEAVEVAKRKHEDDVARRAAPDSEGSTR